eukprot:760647-Hanusia_phi.AAC.8
MSNQKFRRGDRMARRREEPGSRPRSMYPPQDSPAFPNGPQPSIRKDPRPYSPYYGQRFRGPPYDGPRDQRWYLPPSLSLLVFAMERWPEPPRYGRPPIRNHGHPGGKLEKGRLEREEEVGVVREVPHRGSEGSRTTGWGVGQREGEERDPSAYARQPYPYNTYEGAGEEVREEPLRWMVLTWSVRGGMTAAASPDPLLQMIPTKAGGLGGLMAVVGRCDAERSGGKSDGCGQDWEESSRNPRM